jgi:hypothetical protein
MRCHLLTGHAEEDPTRGGGRLDKGQGEAEEAALLQFHLGRTALKSRRMGKPLGEELFFSTVRHIFTSGPRSSMRKRPKANPDRKKSKSTL